MATKLSEVGQAAVDARHAYVTWKAAEATENSAMGHGAVEILRQSYEALAAAEVVAVAGYDADPAPEV